MLQLAYTTDMSEQRMMLYVTKLSNVNPVTLEQAISNLIDRCKFLPTIAEIREECSALSSYVNAHEEMPTALEAWEKVYRVARSYGYEKGLDRLDGITKKCAELIWQSFNPINGDSFNEMSTRSQFIKNYEMQVNRERERNRLSNSIKDNHLLLKAREKAERERALIGAGHKQIEMTSTGNLVEVAKDDFKSIGDIARGTYGKIN
uniref:Replication protein P n=1 Tax=Virus sp. cts3e7 TaxID=2825802 RepID=A0A8S5RNC7_9VIRU|nr:MAG TPA: replication protein P [Virus sp. cts3e7]